MQHLVKAKQVHTVQYTLNTVIVRKYAGMYFSYFKQNSQYVLSLHVSVGTSPVNHSQIADSANGAECFDLFPFFLRYLFSIRSQKHCGEILRFKTCKESIQNHRHTPKSFVKMQEFILSTNSHLLTFSLSFKVLFM